MLELVAAVAESLEVSDMEARALVAGALEQDQEEGE